MIEATFNPKPEEITIKVRTVFWRRLWFFASNVVRYLVKGEIRL